MTLKTGLTALGILLVAAAPVAADWDPDDGHKMHFPQLPDPNGLDVNMTYRSSTDYYLVGDDFRCSASGLITDIHLWVSWRNDDVSPQDITNIQLTLYSDDRTNPDFSQPGERLWRYNTGRNFIHVLDGTGQQGWMDPPDPPSPGVVDHNQFFQVNILIPEDVAYEQKERTIYWLVATVGGLGPNDAIGWKTADLRKYPTPYTGSNYEDIAVFSSNGGIDWAPLRTATGAPIDLAFVITPEPATMALLAVGGLVLARRRRRR